MSLLNTKLSQETLNKAYKNLLQAMMDKLARKEGYFNAFHKESTERSLKSIAKMKKTPINYKEEYARHKRMQEEDRIREAQCLELEKLKFKI